MKNKKKFKKKRQKSGGYLKRCWRNNILRVLNVRKQEEQGKVKRDKPYTLFSATLYPGREENLFFYEAFRQF